MQGLLLLLCLAIEAQCFSLVVTGDVNLNPDLPATHLTNYSYVWGDMLPILKSADLLAINHESTLAGIKMDDPDVIQFEDPLHYVETYGPLGAGRNFFLLKIDISSGADFICQANNHQFDFSFLGMSNTVKALNQAGYNWGGLGNTPQDVRSPKIVKTPGNVPVAFFTLVVDECWKWPNGR